MAYDDQNTHVNITILVVDDDPIFLSIIPNMLKNPRYKDKSFGEIKVMTAKDSSEAMSTLRGPCNKIDFVITDYHMPGLNGVQLKRMIDEEFGNLPVIVISADMNNAIEHESLTNGAMCFMPKPIKPNAFEFIWRDAPNSRTYDLSKKIQETNPTTHPNDGDSMDLTSNPNDGGSMDLTSNLNEGDAISNPINRDSTKNNPNDEDSQLQATRKPKIIWTKSLNNKFLRALDHIGHHKAVPKKILEFMKVEGITREQVASKLQKHRKILKEEKDKEIDATSRQIPSGGVNSNFVSPSYINPQNSYNFNTSLSNNNAFNSQASYEIGRLNFMMHNDACKSPPSHGIGQSNFMMNNKVSESQLGSGVGQSNFMMNNNVSNHPLSDGIGQSNFMMNNNVSESQLGYGVGQSNSVMNNTASKSPLGYGVGQSNFMMNNNVFESQLSYGGQSSFRMNNNAGSNDSIHYMNHRPTSDLCQTGSEMMTMRKSFEVPNGILPLKEKSVNIFGTSQDSQAPTFGQYGTTSNVLGMNSNVTNGLMGSNYVGIELSGYGDLVEHGGVKVNGNGNGMGNSSLGENLSVMNWNSNNTNMNNLGSSTLNISTALSSSIDNQNQPDSNFVVQTDGVLPVLENPSTFGGFNNTINSQFDHHQHQSEYFGMNIDDMREAMAILSRGDNSNWSFNNDKNNKGTLNFTVANSEMQFPTHDLSVLNQELGVRDSMELPLSFDKDWNDEESFLELLDR